jgi:hypothetical protein
MSTVIFSLPGAGSACPVLSANHLVVDVGFFTSTNAKGEKVVFYAAYFESAGTAPAIVAVQHWVREASAAYALRPPARLCLFEAALFLHERRGHGYQREVRRRCILCTCFGLQSVQGHCTHTPAEFRCMHRSPEPSGPGRSSGFVESKLFGAPLQAYQDRAS